MVFESSPFSKPLTISDRSTPIGQSIDAYLKGEAQQEDHVIHLLFSANRWEAAAQMRADIEAGITLIIDRYYMSGIVYSAAKHRPDLDMDWAKQPEIGLPKEDLTVFLSADLDIVKDRGGFGGEVYEKENMQEIVLSLFHELLRDKSSHEKFARVNADRSLDEVELEIREKISQMLSPRLLQQPLGSVSWP